MMKYGIWLNKGDIHDVTYSSHINYIIDNPELFNYTRDEIQETYKEVKERFGKEGLARKKIIKNLLKREDNDWIRIRYYRKGNILHKGEFWRVQLNNFSKQIGYIKNLFERLKEEEKIYTDQIVIIDDFGTYEQHEFEIRELIK